MRSTFDLHDMDRSNPATSGPKFCGGLRRIGRSAWRISTALTLLAAATVQAAPAAQEGTSLKVVSPEGNKRQSSAAAPHNAPEQAARTQVASPEIPEAPGQAQGGSNLFRDKLRQLASGCQPESAKQTPSPANSSFHPLISGISAESGALLTPTSQRQPEVDSPLGFAERLRALSSAPTALEERMRSLVSGNAARLEAMSDPEQFDAAILASAGFCGEEPARSEIDGSSVPESSDAESDLGPDAATQQVGQSDPTAVVIPPAPAIPAVEGHALSRWNEVLLSLDEARLESIAVSDNEVVLASDVSGSASESNGEADSFQALAPALALVSEGTVDPESEAEPLPPSSAAPAADLFYEEMVPGPVESIGNLFGPGREMPDVPALSELNLDVRARELDQSGRRLENPPGQDEVKGPSDLSADVIGNYDHSYFVGTGVVRSQLLQGYYWAAPNFWHRPLYFEQPLVERYGHYVYGDCVQSAICAAHFFATVPILPYKLGAQPKDSCDYTLGRYRPGNCSPRGWARDDATLSGRGLFYQAVTTTGAVFIVP